ncbi:hydrogen gas-evolving membrane-bound hydrogenase subunit E [Patulibacter defluvii]|uniref:hydrogen gas-evolving membrane-bound hydrogenase subunit E n=2 Tax=Bacteria TaxID=2 RepID=UPI002A74CA95|nr:hydrogen gas-evolving membrane-bound hydrogenase subunit E [Patulibacter sp. DM4]
MTVVLLAHAAIALAAPLLVGRLGRKAFLLLALVPLAATAWLATQVGTVDGGGTVVDVRSWVPTFGLDLAFRLDALSLLLALVAAGVGALVLAYCARYFGDDEPGLGRFAGVLVGFAGAMLGLVLADDLLLLYVFWELTTVLSFLLIGHATDRDGARRAAMDALIVTTLGGLAMLVGAVMVGEAAGTYRISEIVAHPPTGATVQIGVGLLLVGAISKSALVPFHFWLPAAMAAPTPVSAYLHAAAMVKAGVYLVARLAPGFHGVIGWTEVVLVLGLATMLLGGLRALRQNDLKLLLAYGTVSQLGLLVVLVGAGTRDAALAGLAMLVAHALYKAALFLVVGIIDRSTGTRDLRSLSGLRRSRPRLALVGTLAAASMAGVPPLAGFAAKETMFGAFEHGGTADALVLAALVLGSILTAAYAARFAWGAFADKPDAPDRRCQRPEAAFEAAPALLAAAGLVVGLAASRLDGLLGRYAATLPGGDEAPLHLAAWHGLGLPLLLTAVALAGGAAIFLLQRSGRSWPLVLPRPVGAALATTGGGAGSGKGTGPSRPKARPWSHLRDARECYVRLIAATERLAVGAARTTQSGSLPAYLMTILLVLIAALTTALLLGLPWEVDLRTWDSPAQAMVAVLVAAAAVLALRARRRLKAVMIGGVVGYGVAMLFALQGAPDLALTQFLVETVSLVVIVLVLRRLPAHFTGTVSHAGRRRLHLLVGVAVGVLMTLVTIVALGAREAVPVSEGMAAAAQAAGGKNIVNTTLVDVRAWDTMGELAVLVVAATGVTSLIFLRRRSRALPRLTDAEDSEAVWRTDPPPVAPALLVTQTPAGGAAEARRAREWLVAENTLAPERRSILLEVVVRLIFHTVLVLSVYLLLAGHDFPGGGFAGGIVAGLALTIRYLAGGRYELGETAPVGAGLLIGLGLVLATGTGLAGAIFGDAILEGGKVVVDLPVVAPLKLYSSTAFDIGVYLVVVGVVLDVLRSFGSEIDRQVDAEEHAR